LVFPLTVLIIKKDRILFKLVHKLDFLVISSIFYYSYYIFYQLGLRNWYSLYTSFLITIIFSIFITRIIQRMREYKKILYLIVILILICFFIFGGVIHYKEGNFPQEIIKYEVAQYLEKNIPPNEIIGSFNTGIYQYYTKNHDIINLDGVMNPEAFDSNKNNDIERYIIKKKISYIADDDEITKQINSSLIILKPIKTFNKYFFIYGDKDKLISYKIFKVIPIENNKSNT